ncbi:hypothetical protein CC2G_006593 [Coprinopsis cinerea AmutBmut pab1-1]|nr:hypothetical protein CC2G_006593 [Coprinopsis cinerea AmutBmut pab1-1]
MHMQFESALAPESVVPTVGVQSASGSVTFILVYRCYNRILFNGPCTSLPSIKPDPWSKPKAARVLMTLIQVPYSLLAVDLQYEILGHLNAADLKAMMEAGCRLASKELLRRFTSILVRFSLDPDEFRTCMKTCDAVVSGSAALAILVPRSDTFLPNDIDLYVSSKGLSKLLRYLHTNTPYTQETILTRTRRSDNDYSILVGGTAISSVRLLEDAASGKSLNVIEASTGSPLSAVWGFHSTLVMNVVLHSGVGCAYPSHALEGIDKYRRRGFRLYPNLVELSTTQDPVLLRNPALSRHLCGTWAYCPQTVRDSLDPGMLWVPFPECNSEDLLADIPSVAWKLAHDGSCSRTLLACPGWLEDVDGRRSKKSSSIGLQEIGSRLL